MGMAYEVSDWIPATPQEIYSAWLSSDEHARMTGSPARVSDEVGADFEAWDGYIQGRNLDLEPPRRILQHWRTREFKDSDPHSLLEILLAAEGTGTRVTIRHSKLPEHGMQYRQGWIDAYFVPMKAHFGHKAASSSA